MKVRLAGIAVCWLAVACGACASAAEDDVTISGRPLSYWTDLLKSEKSSDRALALNALWRVDYIKQGPSIEPAVQPLADALKHEDSRTRSAAAYALSFYGPVAKAAVPALAEAAEDSDPTVRRTAITALGKIGPYAKPAVPVLLRALADEDARLRLVAAEALGSIGPEASRAVPDLAAALKDRDKNVRSFALQSLGRMGEKAVSSLPGIVAALDDSELDVRRTAAGTLVLIARHDREGAEGAVTALVRLIKSDEDAEMRRQAIYTLSVFGVRAEGALPALVAALEETEPKVQRQAARTLGQLGEKAKPAVPQLLAAVKQTASYELRVNAAVAIQRIDPTAIDAAVQILTETLDDADSMTRLSSVDGLQRLGGSAKSALPKLKLLANDPSADVRVAANAAIKRIEGK